MPLRPRLVRAVRAPFFWVLVAFLVAGAVGLWWGLPGTDSWSDGSVSPRASGLGAVAETYTPGHFFRHPPLHLLVLTLVGLPWIVRGALRTDGSLEVMLHELIEPRYMTPIELASRLVTLLLALGVLWNLKRLWARLAGERASLAAVVVVALDPLFVFHSHTGNLDVPWCFWLTLTLVELDRVMAGEGREVPALLAASAAALTQDQAVAPLVGVVPYALWAVPLIVRAWTPSGLRPSLSAVCLRRKVVKGLAWSVGGYLALAGAVVNPTGFARRVVFLRNTGGGWGATSPGAPGFLGWLRELASAAPLCTSPTLAAAALVGLGLVVVRARGASRLRLLAPAVAALSFAVVLDLPARVSLDRYLLPLSLLVLPYAGVAFDAALHWVGDEGRAPALALSGLLLVPPALDVASVDATLLGDSRYRAERFLASLPEGSTLEVHGGGPFLPRLPRRLRVTRVGPEPFEARSPLPGVTELRGSVEDLAARAPDYVLVSEVTARLKLTRPDGDGLARRLADGSLGYALVRRARCEVPAPLRCLRIHRSTGYETWVFQRRARPR